MATYNGRRMRRRRTRAERWYLLRPVVIALEIVIFVTSLWWAGRLLGLA